MSEKPDDKSEESRKNHISYYNSLTKVIQDIQNEIKDETEPQILEHLNKRVEAMDLDKKRIRDMFPDIDD